MERFREKGKRRERENGTKEGGFAAWFSPLSRIAVLVHFHLVLSPCEPNGSERGLLGPIDTFRC